MADELEVRVTPPDASLARLLALVEHILKVQRTKDERVHVDLKHCEVCRQFYKMDIPAFRAAAQQHAEALREVAMHAGNITMTVAAVRAAADFLSARLDPKEEA